MLAVFVIAFGFVTAAFVSAASSIVQKTEGGITLSFDTPLDMLKGFLLCMFVGPYVIGKNGLLLWLEQRIGFSIFGFCILASFVWSFCIGVVMVQTFVGLGLM